MHNNNKEIICNKKLERKRTKPVYTNEGKVLPAEKGLCYLWDVLYKYHDKHNTKTQSRDTKQKKKKTLRNIIENHQTADRNTKEKEQ